MSTETDIATPPLDSFVFAILFFKFIQIGFQNLGSIQMHHDFWTINRNFLVIPLTRWFEETTFGSLSL